MSISASLEQIDPKALEAIMAVNGVTEFESRKDGLWMEAADLDVVAIGHEMIEHGFRMATMSGKAAKDGETEIMYHYAKGSVLLHFKTWSKDGKLPSLASFSHPASWCERELHDFFAVKFEGHPNLAPLLRPSDMEEGFFRDNTGYRAGDA